MATFEEGLIRKVTDYVEEYMNQFDGSHDFNHIKRVVGLSHTIAAEMSASAGGGTEDHGTPLDPTRITLAALLHDVGDRKYVQAGQDPASVVRDVLLRFGAPAAVAGDIQTICLGVSHSAEIQDLGRVQGLIARFPELAVVQDADRLDALGAVGIGRVFTYGGAKTDGRMRPAVAIMDAKLLRLEELMKTGPGRRMAAEATRRLRLFRGWWEEEVDRERVGMELLRPCLAEGEVPASGAGE